MRSTKPKFGNRRKVALLAAVAASVLLGNSVFAMTFDELQAAVDAAEPGATVYVTSDMDVTGTLICSKQITIRSSPGTTNVLSYTDAGLNTMFLDAGSGADVTFADLTIDGRYEALRRKSSNRFMSIHDGGKVTFDGGFTFKDYYCGISATISVGSNGLLTMNDGAELRGLQNDKWGTAVYLKGAASQKAQFVMTGGIIADCKGHGAVDESGQVDGLVYVNSGFAVFTMTGGTISGNTSDYMTAGVYISGGTGISFSVAGAAFVTNNVGAIGNDVYIVGGSYQNAMPQFGMTGDYSGRMTIYISDGAPSSSGQNGVYEGRKAFAGCVGKYTGGAGIEVSADGCETLVVDAYTQTTSGQAVFSRKAARVGPKGEQGVCVSSLSEAFAVVQDSDQIALTTNLNLTTSFTLNSTLVSSGATDFVLCSDVGGPYRVTWDVSEYDANSCLFNIDNSSAGNTIRLRIEDLVFDGRCNAGKCRPFRLGYYSTLVLGSGAVVENVWTQHPGSGVYMFCGGTVATQRLEMENGAVIRNCSCAQNGSAFMATGSSSGRAGELVFVMRGGVISNNVTSVSASSAAGGAVYVGAGLAIEMTGGEIVGNRAENANGVAGVLIGAGSMTVAGMSVITNNVGYYNDAYLSYSTGKMVMSGDFRGSIGVSGSRQQTLNNEFCVDAEPGATGAWCFHAVGRSPAQPNMIGTRDGNVLKWGLATGTVGGRGIVADEEMQAAVATGVSNLTQNARATLPLMLGGRAAELTYEVALDFDGEELYESGELPLVLCSPEDGYALTGRLTASCPEDDKYSWSVRTVNGSYVLMGRPRQGLSIFVR